MSLTKEAYMNRVIEWDEIEAYLAELNTDESTAALGYIESLQNEIDTMQAKFDAASAMSEDERHPRRKPEFYGFRR